MVKVHPPLHQPKKQCSATVSKDTTVAHCVHCTIFWWFSATRAAEIKLERIMSLQQLIEQANKPKEKGKRGHVAEKIATYKSKKRRVLARADAHIESANGKAAMVVKIPKVIRTLLDSINDDDLDQVARVYREAMNAERRYWRDDGENAETGQAKGVWVIEPDHKTRIAAANMVAAYKEGLPVQRQIRLDAHFDELSDVVERFKRSPAAQDFIQRMAAGQVQKSGGEKLVENARVIEPGEE
jgi:hypothetical protein